MLRIVIKEPGQKHRDQERGISGIHRRVVAVVVERSGRTSTEFMLKPDTFLAFGEGVGDGVGHGCCQSSSLSNRKDLGAIQGYSTPDYEYFSQMRELT